MSTVERLTFSVLLAVVGFVALLAGGTAWIMHDRVVNQQAQIRALHKQNVKQGHVNTALLLWSRQVTHQLLSPTRQLAGR